MKVAPLLIPLALLAACVEQGQVDIDSLPFSPVYQGVETALLDGELVSFTVRMTGARAESDVIDYAECAAAGYTLIRGYGFARHLRTNVVLEGGIWLADAVYTISPALPRGLRTIDAEVVAANCDENGIPKV